MPAVEIPLPPGVKPSNQYYEPRGSHLKAIVDRHPEVLLAGPAGTGKTRMCLEKVHGCATKYDGFKGLIVRKTRDSITNSAGVIWEQRVVPPGRPEGRLHHGTQRYRYRNGSFVAVGGLDKSSKVMSSEYDLIYVPEATELTESDWEHLTTRLRAGVMPYAQLLADCNPGPPTHWLKLRCERKSEADPNETVCHMHVSRHTDNPILTPEYLSKLRNLTGVRLKRLFHGLWVAAEGQIYEEWGGNRDAYLLNRFTPPKSWSRIWVVDFGYTNPFVWQEWAIDPDGRIYRNWEIYRTKTLVEDHAAAIKKHVRQYQLPTPQAIICDHDAEDRATLERHLGMATIPARKNVSAGIQAVSARFRVRGDGRPRIFFLRDAHVPGSIDYSLVDDAKPLRTEEELDAYVWDPKKPDQPLKENDHGCDATRYAVAHVDNVDDREPTGLDENLMRIFQRGSLS